MQEFPTDLYSDTKTQPTEAMRRVIAASRPGDEQHGECPITADLIDRCARLLNKETAIFLPSGTMANVIATLVHCGPGDELLAHRDSHLLNFEAGGAAALGGVMVRALEGDRGMFDHTTLSNAIRRQARHLPRSRMVSIEQTTNLGGGAVWPLDLMTEVAGLAREAGLAVHIDGARMLNASVARGLEPRGYSDLADTVYLDFTKGLGAPFGAVLLGSREVIDAAWRWKQRLGGSMRQSGMMAAACIYALEHNVDRLAEDHFNARLLADGLAAIPGLKVREVETNMVFVDTSGTGWRASDFDAAMWPDGVRMSIQGETVLRAVTHMGVGAEGVRRAVAAAKRVALGKGAQT